MRVLVTGARGYLGHCVAKILLQKKRSNLILTDRYAAERILPCDLLSRRDVEYLIGNVSPDCIIHCAAYVPKKAGEYDEPRILNVNVDMFRNILESSECPLLFVSSMTVYGEPNVKPVKENDFKYPSSVYAKSKLACEKLLEQSGKGGFVIRLPGLFGLPRTNGVVYNLLSALKKGEVVHLPDHPVVWASMDVNEAAFSLASLLDEEAPQKLQTLNVGYREKQSINILVKYACAIAGLPPMDYTVHHPLFEFDLENAERYGIVPSVSFFDALKNLFELL